MTNASERLVVNGIELSRDATDPGLWTYVPHGPVIARSPTGARLLQVIAAGPTAFLQATAEIDLPAALRGTLLEALQKQDPDARTVRSAVAAVPRVALEAKARDGAWQIVAEGRSSGLPPFTTALSGMISEELASSAKAALAGERGRLRLVARIVVPAPRRRERRADSSCAIEIEMPTASFESRSEAHEAETSGGADAVLDLEADLAELFPPERDP
jgi:hypothetical protein